MTYTRYEFQVLPRGGGALQSIVFTVESDCDLQQVHAAASVPLIDDLYNAVAVVLLDAFSIEHMRVVEIPAEQPLTPTEITHVSPN